MSPSDKLATTISHSSQSAPENQDQFPDSCLKAGETLHCQCYLTGQQSRENILRLPGRRRSRDTCSLRRIISRGRSRRLDPYLRDYQYIEFDGFIIAVRSKRGPGSVKGEDGGSTGFRVSKFAETRNSHHHSLSALIPKTMSFTRPLLLINGRGRH